MFDHPLTPYYRVKPTALEWLPIHPKEGRTSYRNWTGYRFPTETSRPASCVGRFEARCKDLSFAEGEPRLRAVGYALDNAKVVDFVTSEWPLMSEASGSRAETLRAAAEIVAASLIGALKSALFREGDPVDTEATRFRTARDRFWRETEAQFFALMALPAGEKTFAESVGAPWHRALRSVATRILDDAVPLEQLALESARRLVEARRMLLLTLSGTTKRGRELFDRLDLVPPEPSKTARRRREPAT
jgi:CRISPR type I-E-associated protein CasA/Cse1